MPPSTFISALASFEEATFGELFYRYGLRPISHDFDQKVEQFIDAYLSAAHGEKDLLGCLPPFAANVLCIFGEREAAIAVRAQSRELVVKPLVAIGLAAEFPIDIREIMRVLPLPWHSATLLASDPDELLSKQPGYSPPKGRKSFWPSGSVHPKFKP